MWKKLRLKIYEGSIFVNVFFFIVGISFRKKIVKYRIRFLNKTLHIQKINTKYITSYNFSHI